MKTILKALGVVATVGMFLVLVMGAAVTNTGSARGCGQDWPLCKGKFIPEFAMTTVVEFSHRVAAATETMLIIPLAIGAFYLYGRRREIRLLASLMVAFLFLQAGLGAWAVMYPQMSAVLALHFGVSLVAFASVLLTTVVIFEADGSDAVRDQPMPQSLRWYAWALALYTYVVVYLGALVRHTDADLACKGWPLCNGQLIPHVTRVVATAFVHRVAAAILVALIVGLVAWTWRVRIDRPDLARASLIILGLVVVQSIAGAAVVWTRGDIFSTLAHAGIVGLMFGAITYLCLHTTRRSAVAVRTARTRQAVGRPTEAT
ncbi:MAG: heme A synthase [Chloroflexota bacterium]